MNLKKMSGIVIITLLLLTLFSCATTLNPILPNENISIDSGYIALVFSDKTPSLLGRLFGDYFHMIVKNQDTQEFYMINATWEQKLLILELPAGDYSVTSISQSTSDQDRTTTYHVDIPDIIKYPFNIENGKMLYIGDMNIRKKGFFGKIAPSYSYNVEHCIELLDNSYPNFNPSDITTIN